MQELGFSLKQVESFTRRRQAEKEVWVERHNSDCTTKVKVLKDMHVPLTGKYQDHYAYQSTDKTKSKNLEKLGTTLEW
jgi:hypothetical protein